MLLESARRVGQEGALKNMNIGLQLGKLGRDLCCIQFDGLYIDGLKLRMRTWKRHSTRAKLKNCILPAFRNLECVPPPRMKLFGNQQLECLQGHMFFSRQKRIYILDPPSHHKKGSLPHNFNSFSNFSWYLEVLGI